MGKYEDLCRISDGMVSQYLVDNSIKEKNYTKSKPPLANFTDEDFVINLMGINPSEAKEGFAAEQKDEFLYIVPGISVKIDDKEENDDKDIDSNLKDDIEKHICTNTTYTTTQYRFWYDYEIFKKYIKMPWQDKELYAKGNNKYKIIEEIQEYYKNSKIQFENKYFVFTDLCYISQRDQNKIDLEKYKENIKALFYKQLSFYNADVTIIANSKAAEFVRSNIIEDKEEKWEKVILKGDENCDDEKYINIYKLKDTDEKNKYCYLACRYFDRLPISSRRLFAKEIKKLLNQIGEERNILTEE